MKKNQFIIVLVILFVTLAISVPSFFIVPSAKEEALVSKFPMTVGQWQGKDLPVEERAYEILETKNLVLREYSRGDEKVYFYVIYSQDNRKVSHPPEVCFEGSGVTIVKKAKVPLELAGGRTITANKLVVEKAGLSNVILYWYKAGDAYVDNYLRQQLGIALSRLQFKRTAGALIRLSAEVSLEDPKKAFENIKAFAKEASAYFPEIIP